MLTLTPADRTTNLTSVELGRREWEAILLVALSNGWHPTRTLHDHLETWEGAYHEPRGQLVTTDDATAMANSLARARARARGDAPEDPAPLQREVLEAINQALLVPRAADEDVADLQGERLRGLRLTLGEAWEVLVALDAAALVRDHSEGGLLAVAEQLARAGAFYVD